MRRNPRYQYPEIVGAVTRIDDVPNRVQAKMVWNAAHKFAYRKNWVFRTHWDGQSITIRRAA